MSGQYFIIIFSMIAIQSLVLWLLLLLLLFFFLFVCFDFYTEYTNIYCTIVVLSLVFACLLHINFLFTKIFTGHHTHAVADYCIIFIGVYFHCKTETGMFLNGTMIPYAW